MDSRIEISIAEQRLWFYRDDSPVFSAAVSTASSGPGEQNGSGCTPRGLHQVRARIGEGCPENAVFVGRRFTGEIYTPELAVAEPGRDWILTRILWLSGLESGHNRGGDVDSMRRYIYIHGTPASEPMSEPRSHGCIRMHNADLLQLFALTPAHCPVMIHE